MDDTRQLLSECILYPSLIVIAFLSISCADDLILNNPFDPQVSLSAPNNLQILSLAEFSVSLKWQTSAANTGPDVAKNIFNVIEQSINGGPFVALDTVASATNATVQETILPDTTYYFSVHTIVGSRESGNSNIVSSSISPYAPSNLNSVIVSETQCKLTWKNNALSEIGFQIQRKLSWNGIYTTVGQVQASSTTFIDSTIVLTDSIYYRVCAVYSNKKTSDYCSIIVYTSFTPSNLNAGINNELVHTLTWQNHSISEIGFRIERKTDSNGAYLTVGQVPSNTTQFNDSTLILSDTIMYRVCAVYSNRIGQYDSLVILNSYAPSNFIAVTVGETARKFSWQDNSNFELGFHIDRKLETDVTFKTIGRVPANTTTFIDTAVILTDTNYDYRICADYANGNSTKYCSLAVILTFPAPSDLTLNSLSSNSAELLWTDNSSFESGFLIERREPNGVYNSIALTQPNVTTYTDSQLDSTKSYQYRIWAVTKYNRSGSVDTRAYRYYIPPLAAVNIFTPPPDIYNVFQPSPAGNSIVMGKTLSGWPVDFIFQAWSDVTIYGNTHGTSLSCAAISRNNAYGYSYIATAADDNDLMIWGTEILWGTTYTIPLSHRVQELVFSRDGQEVFGACDDKKIRCWNTSNLSLQFTTAALADSIAALDVTSDGAYVVSASGRSVSLWNISTGALAYTFPDFPNTIGSLKCNSTHIGISGNNAIQVFDIEKKSISFSSAGYSDYAAPFAFSGDGSLLFIGNNTSIEIWRLSDGKLIQTQNMNTPVIMLSAIENQKTVFSIDKKINPIVTFYQYIAQYIWAP